MRRSWEIEDFIPSFLFLPHLRLGDERYNLPEKDVIFRVQWPLRPCGVFYSIKAALEAGLVYLLQMKLQ